MQKTISVRELSIGVLAILALILTGGLLFLPLGLAFFWTLLQRWKEVREGEEDEAKKY